MIGAVVGDIVGSVYEFNNHKSKAFELFTDDCYFTDDSVMTLAVCDALLAFDGDYDALSAQTVVSMQRIGRPYRSCGYGERFYRWMYSDHPQPYYSFGNGAAMRVSGCGYVGNTLEEVKALSAAVTKVTHDHQEGLKGAEATAVAVFLARTGSPMAEIRRCITEQYYPLDFTIDGIRDTYTFDVTCQGSVPQAMEAFFESADFEDAIRIAISVGGDSDTIAAITGSIAEAFYGVPAHIRDAACAHLDGKLLSILADFERRFPAKVI